jgi:hypothetical protein
MGSSQGFFLDKHSPPSTHPFSYFHQFAFGIRGKCGADNKGDLVYILIHNLDDIFDESLNNWLARDKSQGFGNGQCMRAQA